MASFKATVRKVHRTLAYLVFAQITLWVLGGVVFSIVPFDSVVKGGAVIGPQPAPAFPSSWAQDLQAHSRELPDMQAVTAHHSGQGPLYELRAGESSRYIRMVDGQVAEQPSPEQMASFAAALYQGEAAITATRYLSAPEYRYLGLVDELYGRTGVWQVSFDDGYRTRLYFDGETGRYLTVRNDFWVLYDALWRLHIMDYSDGEDFNNILLRVVTPLTLIFVVSGLILTGQAGLRVLRRRGSGVRA